MSVYLRQIGSDTECPFYGDTDRMIVRSKFMTIGLLYVSESYLTMVFSVS